MVHAKNTQTESETGEDPEKTDEDKADRKDPVKHWSIERFKKEYRKFNVDLAPKVLDWENIEFV